MKEATGEANMTIVTVIIIAAIVAIGTPIIIGMMDNMSKKTECLNDGSKYWDEAAGECVDVRPGTTNNG